MTQYILDHKGEEVISERHQKDFKKLFGEKGEEAVTATATTESFTDVSFDDI